MRFIAKTSCRLANLSLLAGVLLVVGCVQTDPTVTGGPDATSDTGTDTSEQDTSSQDSGADTTTPNDTSQDPCENVTCSGNGTCFERSGAMPECVCDSGYRPDGLSCVEVDPNEPCDGVGCSGNGTCEVVEGEPSCNCESGFESGGQLTCVAIDPCEGETCSGHGTCVNNGGIAECDCDPQYEAGGLTCTPEDADGDGDDFTVDCDDNDDARNTSATEVCDGIDNNCNSVVDEGEVCGIWVLEPLASEWKAYGLDPSASGNAPSAKIRAAFDIESEDLAYVMTDTGFHVLRIGSLSWQASKVPLSTVATGLDTLDGPATSAIAIPADHAGGDGTTESVQISGMRGPDKIVWSIEFDIGSRSFSANTDSLYNEAHTWDDPNSPDPSNIRAAWLDVDNVRGWMDANPSNYCDTTRMSVDPYLAFLTSDRLYMSEAGICFTFTHNLALNQSPLAQPANPPPFDEVGAAFWHQGSLYLLRGE